LDGINRRVKIYRQGEGFGNWPYGGIRDTGAGPSPGSTSRSPGIFFISGSAEEQFSQLEPDSKQSPWLVGGSDIIAQYMGANFIDETISFVMPLLLGAGIP